MSRIPVWSSMAANRKSLCLLNMEACNVGEVHPCWKSVDSTVIDVVVVVRIFNASRHPRHVEAAAIAMMYKYLYSLAFMDHPCKLGAAYCHQAPPCPLYTQPRARRV